VTIRPIHLLGSPVLRQRAEDVEEIDDGVKELIKDLLDTTFADDGLGLAANQVGVARQVAVVVHGDEPPLFLINPTLVEQEGTSREEEGCLSIPDLFANVDRPARVVVETDTLEGTRVRVEAEEIKARAIMHEMDHLNGVLFIDHVSPLKRRMLLMKWKKQRKGKVGYLKHLTPVGHGG
jgi:peptide deformylase